MLKSTSAVKLGLYVRIALILHAVVLVLFILYVGRALFIPLFLSLLIALLVFPLARFFERRLHFRRGLAAAIAVFLFVVFISGLVFFFSMEIGRFSEDFPHLKVKINDTIQHVGDWISTKFGIDDAKQKAYVSKSSNDLVSQLINSAGTTFLGIVELIVISIFCLFISYFMLLFRSLLKRFLLALVNKSSGSKVEVILQNTQTIINSYVIGLFVEMFLIVLLSLPVLLILHVKYALLFAALAAFLNLIPYVGIYTATALAMLISFADGSGQQAVGVAITFILIHMIDANIILPRIVGRRVQINPLITIIAVFAGKLFWGIPGMFLFIPLVAICKIISSAVESLKPWAILLGDEK